MKFKTVHIVLVNTKLSVGIILDVRGTDNDPADGGLQTTRKNHGTEVYGQNYVGQVVLPCD